MTVGQTIRQAREARGLSINELAGILVIAPHTLGKYELDAVRRPTPLYLRGIASALGLDGDALVALSLTQRHDREAAAA